MAQAAPWPTPRRVAIAVSGGADSLSLALLARRWGNPFAFIVDHGLRPDSANEAAQAASTLTSLGVPSRILTLHGLRLRPGLAARARHARYEALAGAMRALDLVDLLLGHHAADQAETVLLRRQAGSGETGLAGMALVTETADHRLVRPLLGISPRALRDALAEAGIAWAEDPSNHNLAATRPRLRQRLRADPAEAGRLLLAASRAAPARAERDHRIARILCERATIFREGYALLTPGPIDPGALGALLRALSGAAYPAPTHALARMAADPHPGTLAGMRLLPAGRLGPGLLLLREEAALQPPIEAMPGAVWDRRFILDGQARPPAGATIGALAHDSPLVRGASSLPSAILRTLPTLRLRGEILAVPHARFFNGWTLDCGGMTLHPANPASGAPFASPRGMADAGVRSGAGDAEAGDAPHVG